MFRTSVHGFLPDLSHAYNIVRVIEIKLYRKQKLLRISRRFELSQVWATEGKITVNVRRKSRGNRLWFELARFRVIGSQLYSFLHTLNVGSLGKPVSQFCLPSISLLIRTLRKTKLTVFHWLKLLRGEIAFQKLFSKGNGRHQDYTVLINK